MPRAAAAAVPRLGDRAREQRRHGGGDGSSSDEDAWLSNSDDSVSSGEDAWLFSDDRGDNTDTGATDDDTQSFGGTDSPDDDNDRSGWVLTRRGHQSSTAPMVYTDGQRAVSRGRSTPGGAALVVELARARERADVLAEVLQRGMLAHAATAPVQITLNNNVEYPVLPPPPPVTRPSTPPPLAVAPKKEPFELPPFAVVIIDIMLFVIIGNAALFCFGPGSEEGPIRKIADFARVLAATCTQSATAYFTLDALTLSYFSVGFDVVARETGLPRHGVAIKAIGRKAMALVWLASAVLVSFRRALHKTWALGRIVRACEWVVCGPPLAVLAVPGVMMRAARKIAGALQPAAWLAVPGAWVVSAATRVGRVLAAPFVRLVSCVLTQCLWTLVVWAWFFAEHALALFVELVLVRAVQYTTEWCIIASARIALSYTVGSG